MKGQFLARVLANVAYGVAGVWKSIGIGNALGCRKSLSKLLAAISKEAKQRLDEFNAQNLANMAWVFATLKLPDEKLFAALARVM